MLNTKSEILARLLLDIPDKYDKTPGSFFYDTQKPLAIEAEKIYAAMDEILSNGFASTATGDYLDKKVAEQGLVRKTATYSNGIVTLTGIVGAPVPLGAKVSSDNIIFSTVAATTILEGGTVDVEVICDIAGISGNLPPGTIKTFPVTLSGITGVNNAVATTGGYPEETDDELRARYFEKVSAPATSGNKYHYVMWAKEVAGVGDAKCIPIWDGPGTVKVIIIDANRQAAEEILIENVENYIEENRPIGATVTVESATPLAVNISATLTLKSGYLLENIQPFVDQAIDDYLKAIAFKKDYISYAHIGRAILQVEGVLDYEDLLINETAANIDVAETEVPVLGVMTLV